MKDKFRFRVFLCFLFLSTNLIAAENSAESEDLSNLSLEQLLNVRASIAETGKDENIAVTPGIVSRYEMDDMRKMGMSTLPEVLDFIPGVEIKRTMFGHFAVSIRGLFDTFNQKVLFMVDGTPYYMFSHSLAPILGIPLASISHVEVIRGSGAVIFGTNASAGVINVVLKKDGNNTVYANAGSRDYVNGGGFFSKNLGENKNLFFSFEASDGGNFKSFFDQGGGNGNQPAGEVTLGNKIKSVIGGLKWDSTNFVFSAFDVESYGVSFESAVTNQSIWTEKSIFAHLDNTINLFGGKFKSYFDYNNYYPNIFSHNSTTFSPGNSIYGKFVDRKNRRIRGGFSFEKIIRDNFNFLAGVEHENRASGDYVLDRANGGRVSTLASASSVNEFSTYLQGDYRYESYRFLIGGRYTDHQQGGKELTPRAAIVYNLNRNSSLKFLYSKGFNSANALQKNANGATLIGNEKLGPEKTETYDLAYSYVKNNMLFIANIYKTKLTDGIQRSPNPTGQSFLIYLNKSRFERYGSEIDFQKAFDNVTIFSNLSYIHKANERWADDANNALSPRLMIALGSSYKFFEKNILGFNFSYKSSRSNPTATKEVTKNYLLDLNFEREQGPVRFFASIKNVLDEEVRDPGVGSVSAVTYTTDPGRTYEAGLKYLF